jgi:hypothetical protein
MAIPADRRRRSRQLLIVSALAISIVLVLSSLLVVPYITTNSATQSDNQRRIIAFDVRQIPKSTEVQEGDISYDTIIDLRYVRTGDIPPNSFVWFFNPFDNIVYNELYQKPITSLTDREKKDALEKIDRYAYYNLIRLPEWLGGSEENSASAYRAYNAISLTQKCLARYWPQEGRMRMEDPCAGDAYRSWDGLAFGGPAGQGFSGGFIGSRGTYQGLADLGLAVDSEGHILALRPDTRPNANGIAGEGRVFSVEQLRESNRQLIAAASSHLGYALPFPEIITPDYRLADIRESYRFANMYNLNREGSLSPVLEAAYVDQQSYEGITITSAQADRFPSLSFDRLTKQSVDGVIAPDLNNTDLRSLLGIYGITDDFCFFSTGKDDIRVPYSIDHRPVKGNYTIIHAPDVSNIRQQSSSINENFTCGSHAVIWGKSTDGREDIIVQIQTVNYDLDQLQTLVRNLPIN